MNPPSHSFTHRASNILQSLLCLNYLIRDEATDPGKVQQYADMADERIHAMQDLLRTMHCDPTPATL